MLKLREGQQNVDNTPYLLFDCRLVEGFQDEREESDQVLPENPKLQPVSSVESDFVLDKVIHFQFHAEHESTHHQFRIFRSKFFDDKLNLATGCVSQ